MSQPPDASAIVIDARGHRCPTPTLRLRRGLERCAPGAVVELWADDPLARIDIPHFVTQTGDELLALEMDGRTLRFRIRRR